MNINQTELLQEKMELIENKLREQYESEIEEYPDTPELDDVSEAVKKANDQKLSSRQPSLFASGGFFKTLVFGFVMISVAFVEGILLKTNFEVNFGFEAPGSYFAIFVVLMIATWLSTMATPKITAYYNTRDKRRYRWLSVFAGVMVFFVIIMMSGFGFFNGEVASINQAQSQELIALEDDMSDEAFFDEKNTSPSSNEVNSNSTVKISPLFRNLFFAITTLVLFIGLVVIETFFFVFLNVYALERKKEKDEKTLSKLKSKYKSIQAAKRLLYQQEMYLAIETAQMHYLNYLITSKT